MKSIRSYYFSAILVFFAQATYAQNEAVADLTYINESSEPTSSSSCLPDGITFPFQDDIDSFSINYPGCKTILGNVLIVNQVENLDGLIQLEHIDGVLYLESVTDITGLQNLMTCHGAISRTVISQGSLSSLQVLDGTLSIKSPAFSAKGFESLEIIRGDISTAWSGGINLSNLQNLKKINGSISALETSFYTGSLPQLKYIGGLNFQTSTFSTVGLGNVTQIGEIGINIQSGSNVDFSGLTSLIKLDGPLNIKHGCNATGLQAFENLTRIESLALTYCDLDVTNLAFLSSLDTLNNLHLEHAPINDISELNNTQGLQEVWIKDCQLLTECNIQPICNLISENGDIIIENNGQDNTGCNSIQEIQDACNTDTGCSFVSGFTKLGEYNGHGYYLSNTTAPWAQAKILSENAGGYLTAINDQPENDFIKDLLNNNMVFIGYNDEMTEGAGQWTNNEQVTLDLSYGNTGEYDYAVMNYWLGTWQMYNGLGYRKFILEMNCSPSPPTPKKASEFILRIYPNPANDLITLEVNSVEKQNTTFHIYDGRGQWLLSKNSILPQGTSTLKIDVANLPIGMYFVKNAHSTSYQKFVILR